MQTTIFATVFAVMVTMVAGQTFTLPSGVSLPSGAALPSGIVVVTSSATSAAVTGN
ncbi:uncharacterized protein BCR38DRAFT_422770 [Pseudomassariella vexata]|uniref:Uncharacterized protein n=1 Tax=Pseudomassariella vexata TaxID=1141098 RepID=A0A1Y2E9T7_9PEZI|nr:uncharacterized protein BCR38DRAFT_422770 [Pseudomassariella vexata]ORY68333.1 hypothetical protein BCR38DRAFT_422770 [Pseudomassariella vexata]